MAIKIDKKNRFGLWLFFYFLNMTMEGSMFSMIGGIDRALSIFRSAILMICLISVINDEIKIDDRSILPIGIFLSCSLFNMIFWGGGIRFMIILLLVIYSRCEETREIFKISTKGLTVGTLIVVLSSLLNMIPDMVNHRSIGGAYIFLSGEYTRHSFGFLMSNQLPFILCYLYLYTMMSYKKEMKWIWHILFQMINMIVFSYCGSRVIFVVVIFVGTLQIIWKIRNYIIPCRIPLRMVIIGLFPGITLTCFIGIYLFGKNLMDPVNIFLNFRFSNMYETVRTYGIHLFGNESCVGTTASLNGVVVDNGYAMLFLQKGMVIGSLIIACWTWIANLAVKTKDIYLITCVIALVIINVVDYHFTSYMNIPFYCYIVHKKSCLKEICCRGSSSYKMRAGECIDG